MPHSRHEQLDTDATRQLIAKLYLEGHGQYQIAEQLGITQQGVSYHICALREGWRASAEADSHHHFTQDLLKLTKIERELWKAWERSKLPRERTLTEQVEGETGRRKASIMREGQAGDPAYLAAILTCLKRRAAMLGYDAPKRFRLDLDSLTDEELTHLARGEFHKIPGLVADA